MSSTFVYLRRVQFAETDMAGIAHFSNFMRWMEEAEHAFFRDQGFSVHAERNGEMLGWPRLSAHCDFKHPARFEDELEVHLKIERIGGKTLHLQFNFSNGEKELAEGRFVTICCRRNDDGGLESVAIPNDIRDKFEAFQSGA